MSKGNDGRRDTTTDYDRYQQLTDDISVIKERKRTVGLFDWFSISALMGFNGMVLSSMVLFIPQSNIYLALVFWADKTLG